VLLLDVIAVIVWLGAGFTMDLLFLPVERTGNPATSGRPANFRSGWCRGCF
jgi:hypothetical protein